MHAWAQSRRSVVWRARCRARRASSPTAPAAQARPTAPAAEAARTLPARWCPPASSTPAARASTPLGPGEVRNVQITGRAGIPATAVAVALNVTAVAPTVGRLPQRVPGRHAAARAARTSTSPPARPCRTWSSSASASGGQVSILNGRGTTHVLVDVAGWFSGGFNPIGPTRLPRHPDAGPGGRSSPARSATCRSTGVAGIPKAATAVALNVTVTGPTAAGFAHVSTRPGRRRPARRA